MTRGGPVSSNTMGNGRETQNRFANNAFNNMNAPESTNYNGGPEILIMQLKKLAGGLGLSIVAAKPAGRKELGIYIKSLVRNGAADLDGRLCTGDQLLAVNGHSLVGISQEEAAQLLTNTSTIVILHVAKQAAIYQGISSMLNESSPEITRGVDPSYHANGRNQMSNVEQVPVYYANHQHNQFQQIPSKSGSLQTNGGYQYQHQPSNTVTYTQMESLPVHLPSTRDNQGSHAQRFDNQHYHAAYMSSQPQMHGPKTGTVQHANTRSGQNINVPSHRQFSSPVTYRQDQLVYNAEPTPVSYNPKNSPMYTYIPDNGYMANSPSKASRLHRQHHGETMPVPPHQNWPRSLTSKDLLRQEAKMFEMQDELRRREERAALMMAKIQQTLTPGHLKYQDRQTYNTQTNDHVPSVRSFKSNRTEEEFSASTIESPLSSPSSASVQHPSSPSPWEREAREEEEANFKRESTKHRRATKINELETLITRTSSEDELLQELKFEGEFQRRAEEMKHAGEEGEEEEEQCERKAMIRQLQEQLENNRISNGKKLEVEEHQLMMRDIMNILNIAQARKEILKREYQKPSVSHHSPSRNETSVPVAGYQSDNRFKNLNQVTTSSSSLSKFSPSLSPSGEQNHDDFSALRKSPQHIKAERRTVSFQDAVVTRNEPASTLGSWNHLQEDDEIIDATTMLEDTENVNEMSSTIDDVIPGVIGSQEVYRDPVMRRHAEKQQRQQEESVSKPEKLSFKDKMKLFAIELGEPDAPKEKVKASKAQREIEDTTVSTSKSNEL